MQIQSGIELRNLRLHDRPKDTLISWNYDGAGISAFTVYRTFCFSEQTECLKEELATIPNTPGRRLRLADRSTEGKRFYYEITGEQTEEGSSDLPLIPGQPLHLSLKSLTEKPFNQVMIKNSDDLQVDHFRSAKMLRITRASESPAEDSYLIINFLNCRAENVCDILETKRFDFE